MKVGDLVKVINEWAYHNPWMKHPDQRERIGLVAKFTTDKMVSVYIDGKELIFRKTELEVICK